MPVSQDLLLCNVHTTRLMGNGLLVFEVVYISIFKLFWKCVNICDRGLRLHLVVDDIKT